MFQTARPNLLRWIVLVAVLVLAARSVEGARVAHEGFMNPPLISSLLTEGGHVPVALTVSQVERGALNTGSFDVFVISRYTTQTGASPLYVSQVGIFIAAGGSIVTELSGAGMFFSGYASDVTPISATRTPQLQVFSAIFHAGAFHEAQTPVVLQDPAHPVAAGLPNPLREYYGEEQFHWVETADADLRAIGTIRGNGTANGAFPRGQDLPCLLVGCFGHSSFVFGTWDWSDSLGLNGFNRILFRNAVNFASRGCNSPPVCEITGQYRQECQGPTSTVVLDGSRSSDPEGDPLSYLWTSDCPGALFDDPSLSTPRLTVDTSAGCGISCRVTLTVSDGLAACTASAAVSFEDSTPPVLVLNGPAYLALEARIETYTEQGATAGDLCDPLVTVVIGGRRVDTTVPGTYTVTYDASDRCANAAGRIIRTVVVQKTIPPAFTRLSGDLTVECEGPQGVPSTAPPVAAFLQSPETNEGCDQSAGIVHNAPDLFPPGSTVVTWTARDLWGSPVTASRTVRVADSTPPTMVSPADAILECPADTGVEVNGIAGAADRCGDVAIAYSDTFEPGCGATGTIHRAWSATDGSGNRAGAVQVIRLVDTTPPAITLNGAGRMVLEARVDRYVEPGAAAADPCDGDVDVAIGGDRVNPSVPGIFVVTYDAQDRCGNRALKVTRTVVVRDTIPPTFTGLPNDLTVESAGPDGVSASEPSVAAFLASAQASDSCDGSVGVSQDAPAVFPLGDTLVTWMARDFSGNPVTAFRMVHVVDTTAPDLACPADVLAEFPHDTGIEVNGRAEASDLCSDVRVAWSDTRVPGCGPTETVSRTWTALDGSGNSRTCVQIIRVVDTTAPDPTASAAALDGGQRVQVRFGAVDAGGLAALLAVIDTGCRKIPVQDGQVVPLAAADFECLSGSSGAAAPRERSVRLVVTAEDTCGNKAGTAVDVAVQMELAVPTPSASPFLRGDANRDGKLRFDDVAQILKIALGKVSNSPCLDAADANDDGRVKINDAVLVAIVLVHGGRLPLPYPAVGQDPTPDSLGCTLSPPSKKDCKSPGKLKDKCKDKEKDKETPKKDSPKKR